MITGIASHFNNKKETTAITASKYFGKLFFREKSLNFNAINGNVETINHESNKINAYKNHLFSNKSFIHCTFSFQYINGSDATKIPTAGTGIPLNE